jgi:hypothetical protein
MADGSVNRSVTIRRIAQGVLTATNTRGGQLRFGTAKDEVLPKVVRSSGG